ncbi:50S ribosomal protein L18 [Patescibacteria group bacterium]|nr:50S ribosomal protein L18 [Patescibacteria group bacterium]
MKDQNKIKNQLKQRRAARVRGRINGGAQFPRIAVFKSLKHLSVQAIDDTAGKTLASVYDTDVKAKDKKTKAKEIGLLLAKKLLEKKVTKAVFDRRHYKYHGLVKEIVEGIREGGVKI